jgi:hypothetical protein
MPTEREVLDLIAAGRSSAQIRGGAVPRAQDGAQQRSAILSKLRARRNGTLPRELVPSGPVSST